MATKKYLDGDGVAQVWQATKDYADQPDHITDAMLAQTGGVLESVDQITKKMQLMQGDNWCSGVTSGSYMGLDGTTYASETFAYTDLIPVSAGEIIRTYTTQSGSFELRTMRFITTFDANGNAVASSGAGNITAYMVPSGITGLVVTTKISDNYMVTKNKTVNAYKAYFAPYYLATKDFLGALAANKTAYERVSGSIASGGTLALPARRSAIKDGQTVVFKGHLTSFGTLCLGFSNTSQDVNYVEVDATNITVKNTGATPTPVAHGLTIQNDLTIVVAFVHGKATVTIISDGERYESEVAWAVANSAIVYPRVVSTGTVCDTASLESVYPAARRKLWYFGDSYISFNNNKRWPYYLGDLDYNVMFSGSAGCNSSASVGALNGLLKYGTPDIAVFATGMNDGSDATTPPDFWVTQRDSFLSLCVQNEIEPIFCTVPTVPTVNNEQKNAWVKSSGYRYIDFAAAVGANASGEWYAGMLSSDNVHPSAKGARALYSQVLADLPEIFIPA